MSKGYVVFDGTDDFWQLPASTPQLFGEPGTPPAEMRGLRSIIQDESTLFSKDPQDKEDIMSINKHDLYLTPGEEWDIRNGNQATAHAAIVRILPPVIELNVGDVVRFDGDEKYDYKIVLIHEDDLVVQRLVGNSSGGAGEPVPAKLSSYVEKIRRGRAEVLPSTGLSG